MKLKYVMLVSFMVVSLKGAEAADDRDDLAHSKNLSVLENPLRLLLQIHGSRLTDQDIFQAFQGHEKLTHNARRAIQHKLFDAAIENSVQEEVDKNVKKKADGSYVIRREEGKEVETDGFMVGLLLQELKQLNRIFVSRFYAKALESAQEEKQVATAMTAFAQSIFNGQTAAHKK